MEFKTFRADIKARQDGSKGIVDALVSVIGNVDLGNDRIMPGAFKNTINEWQMKGDPLPVIWSHEWDKPEAHVGFVDPSNMEETPEGLKVRMQFDLDRPFAEQVFHLLKSRRVTQFSFGYFARKFEMVQEDGKDIRELLDLEVFEVGPTLLGMNPATQLLNAASASRLLHPTNQTINAGAESVNITITASKSTDEVPAPTEDAPVVETPAEEAEKSAQTDVLDAPSTEAASDTTLTIDHERLAELLILSRD